MLAEFLLAVARTMMSLGVWFVCVCMASRLAVEHGQSLRGRGATRTRAAGAVVAAYYGSAACLLGTGVLFWRLASPVEQWLQLTPHPHVEAMTFYSALVVNGLITLMLGPLTCAYALWFDRATPTRTALQGWPLTRAVARAAVIAAAVAVGSEGIYAVTERLCNPHATDPDPYAEFEKTKKEQSERDTEQLRREVYSNPEAERLWKRRNEINAQTGAVPTVEEPTDCR